MAEAKNQRVTATSDDQPRRWAPSALGRFFTRAPAWTLSFRRNTFVLDVGGKSRVGNVLDLENLKVEQGLFWAAPTLKSSAGTLRLGGLRKSEASQLEAHLRKSIEREKTTRQLDAFVPRCKGGPRPMQVPYEPNRSGEADLPVRRNSKSAAFGLRFQRLFT